VYVTRYWFLRDPGGMLWQLLMAGFSYVTLNGCQIFDTFVLVFQ